MGKFDESKDKKVAEIKFGDLSVSVRQYDGGEPKLQIGPRINGDGKVRKAGRLTAQEAKWLFESGVYLTAKLDEANAG